MANVTFVFPVDFLDIKGREDSAPESCPDSRGRSDYRDRRSWQTYSRRNSYGPRLPLCASLKVESVSEDVMEVVVGTGTWNSKTPLTQPWPGFPMWIVLSWMRESSHMSCMIDQCLCRMNLRRQKQCLQEWIQYRLQRYWLLWCRWMPLEKSFRRQCHLYQHTRRLRAPKFWSRAFEYVCNPGLTGSGMVYIVDFTMTSSNA